MKKKSSIGKFFTGLGVGAALGVLFSPKKGSETRKEIKNKYDEIMAELSEMDLGEIKDLFLLKINEIKEDLENIDGEKVLKMAQKKGQEIKTKTDELIKIAKKNASPMIEKVANEVKENAINVIEKTLNKLKDSDKKQL